MKTINHLFSSSKRFKNFLLQNSIDPEKEHFVQVFVGNNDPECMKNVLNVVNENLPSSSAIGTSTAGEIVEGGMVENSTVISITTFESTKVKIKLFEGNSEEEIADQIVSTMISLKTKLVLAFNNVFANDGEDFLEALEERLPNIKIAGGNAGDNGDFSLQTTVGANDEVSTTAIAVAVFDSDTLQVFNDYLFNWQTIGEAMVVTKAEKSVIYEINNQKAQDIYRHFLGKEVAEALPLSGVEFPLIFNEDDIDIARAPVAVGEDGSLVMAGHIEEGSTIKFGFGDISENDKSVTKTLQKFSNYPIESIFIYSCSARKYFFKDHLNSEFEMLQSIAPTSGFITYGEFFRHKRYNKMLNVSSTFVGLSENSDIKHDLEFKSKELSSSSRTLHALTHLVKQTSKHVEEKNHSLNQFKELIKESSIYSSTDLQGIITDVNKTFIELSGYSKEELIGSPHNIIRHPSMPRSLFEDMWNTIQNKKPWHGIIKNRAKNGNNYYVRSNIFPILDVNNEILEYVSVRDDITEEMQREELLEGTLDHLREKTKEKEYMLKQYEEIINLSSAFFRIDKNFQILHVNDVFCDIYGLSNEELSSKTVMQILESNFLMTQFDSIYDTLLKDGIWSGEVPFMREDESLLYMQTSVSTVYDKEGNIAEFMIVLNDITDLIEVQEEIKNTQKDVVYTMGAIGETRSKETGNHVKRVAEYSKLLAIYSGMHEDEAELLKMASPMHDIGKVGIPDSILNKPGKLTEEEWKIMKTHSKLGYSMLKNSKREILQAASIVALSHHEKWDGSGYPNSLSGKHIHIYGRITAVADVFDALGSDRCYKKAWDDEKIFQLFRDEKGKHFDPDLVDIFFKHLGEFLEIRSRFRD